MTKPQVTADHYDDPSFRTKGRFASIWHQINEIERSGAKTVLEIGPGGGFLQRELPNLLKVKAYSLDIDPMLNPTAVADVRALPFKDASFDAVVAFEVLEHLPFNNLEGILREFARVARKSILLSLPDAYPFYYLNVTLPLIGVRTLTYTWQRSTAVNSPNKTHYWEIGLRDYPTKRVVDELIKGSGFKLIRTFRVLEQQYHCFFILQRN